MIFKAFLASLLSGNVMTISPFHSCHEVFEKESIRLSVCPECTSVYGYNPVAALTGAILLNFNFRSVYLTQNIVETYNR